MNCIHFLNTGYSDCIILESGGKFAMIDAAEDTDYPKNKPHLKALKGYENEVVNYLLTHCADENGMVTLEFVLGTHCHSDHIGGFDTVILHPAVTVKKAYLKPYYSSDANLLERYSWDNEEVYNQMKDALKDRNVPIIESFDKATDTVGDIKLTFYNGTYKKPRIPRGENASSIVTVAECDGARAVLPGDMNYKYGGEKELAPLIGKVDLLKVAHHGYMGSSGKLWLGTLKPKYCVIPNFIKSVHPTVKRRIKKITGAEIFTTADHNGVKAIFSNGDFKFERDIM